MSPRHMSLIGAQAEWARTKPKAGEDVCPIRAKCCTTADARKIPRDLHEDARDIARQKMKTKAFAKSRDERKRVEMRFAHLKTQSTRHADPPPNTSVSVEIVARSNDQIR
jgi:hypothetical protein